MARRRRAGAAGRRLRAMACALAALLLVSPFVRAEDERLTLSPPFAPDGDHGYTVAAPEGWVGDRVDAAQSRLVLYEDERPLGPAHALHRDIRRLGGGRFSHWAETLYFSTSDNSDPNTNGRSYSVGRLPAPAPGQANYSVLPPRGLFDHLDDVALARGVGAVRETRDPPAASDGRPTIVYWYTIDALRHDVARERIDGEPLMPRLAAFAEDAVDFRRAYATSSFTKVSTASMFTGLWPRRHGVMHGVIPTWPDGGELFFDLDPRFYTLSEFLADHGYETWTHPFTVHVRRGDGMLQGFDHADLATGDAVAVDPLPARLFAYEHILGLHGPYDPSEDARRRLRLEAASTLDPAGTDWFDGPLDDEQIRELAAAYRAEGVDSDRQLGRRLDWLRSTGRWDDALVIVTADHGEAFLEHGSTQHSVQLYEEVVRVPLLVKFPAGHRWAAHHGTVVDQRVRLVDLFPTLVEMVAGPEAALPYALDGASLGAILDGRETDPNARDVLLRTSVTARVEGSEHQALFVCDAVIHGQMKAHLGYRITSSQDRRQPFSQGDWIAELYDLSQDPGEARNLVEGREHEFAALTERLSRATRALHADHRSAPAAEPTVPDEELLERLRALGYVR